MKVSINQQLAAGFVLALLLVLTIAALSFANTLTLVENSRSVAHTDEVLSAIRATLSTVQDAESGQRGYVITGQESYLDPYHAARAQIDPDLNKLAALTADNPDQQRRIATLREQIATRIGSLENGITVRQTNGFAAAQAAIRSGNGQRAMNAVRATVDEMERAEQDLLAARQARTDASTRSAMLLLVLLSVLALVLVGAVGVLLRRERASRRQAEAARLRATLTSIGDAVVTTDTDGRVTFLNAEAERLTGWAGAAATGQPLETVFQIIREDTHSPVPSPVRRVLDEGIVVGLANHTSLRSRAGAETPIEDSGAPIRDVEGRLIGVVLVFRDISARRRAERTEAFLNRAWTELTASLDYPATLDAIRRLVLPAFADSCVVDQIDAEGTVRRVAVAAADPDKEALLKELQRRYPVDPKGAAGRPVLETGQPLLLTEIGPVDLETRTVDAGHQALIRAINPTSLVIVPFLARGRSVGLLTLSYNDGHGRYTEADLPMLMEFARRAGLALDNARLYQEAQDAVAVRDQFMAIASHELRTPLTSVLAAAQLLERRLGRDGALSARDRRALSLVVQQAVRLNRMVLSLLDLSRIETGQLSVERAPVDLGALAHRLAEEAQPVLDDHPLVLQVPEAPVMVEGDALRLEQVVQNLIQNAAKYSPAGAPITLGVAAAGGTAAITVQDTGIGIPAAALPHLFQRFYRAPHPAGQVISGMGIGLYVVREIVTLHGGTVEVASTEGAGSTFTVRLPLRPVPASYGSDTR